MILSREIIKKWEEILHLTFSNQTEMGNVCYAFESEEIKDSYKLSFTLNDILLYEKAILAENNNPNQSFYYPKNAEEFWAKIQNIKKG